MFVSEAYDLFKTEYIAMRGLTDSTEENYDLAVLSLTRCLGDIEIDSLTTMDILKWRRCMEKTLKQGTIRGYMSKIKNLLIFTNKKKLTLFDITELYLPKVPPPLPEYLTPVEVSDMIRVTESLRDKAILSFMFSSGVRSGELSRLNKSDLVDNQVYIRQGKCNTSRTVFIDSRTQDLLEQYYNSREDNSPLMFDSYQHGKLSTSRINKIVKEAARGARIMRHVHAHMLRHSFATNLIKNGCDISFVQKFLGHSFVSTTQIYVHLNGQDLSKAYANFHKTY